MNKLLILSLIGMCMLLGCRSRSLQAGSAGSLQVRVYHVRGKVISTNLAKGEAVLDHEAISGFMDAMTMPYKLKDASILTELHPGDKITADVLVSSKPGVDIQLDHIVVISYSKPDYRPQVSYHVPAVGDAVPDFVLTNQDGRKMHLSQFKGKELLITFIYTSCPRSDFCPLITRNFAAINRLVSADPALYKKTHLLCVSFDLQHDTTARMRAYGAMYAGAEGEGQFAHWDFAVPDKPALEKMSQFFNVGISSEADGTITHTLSTTLIGKDGKVAAFYPGNDWTVAQVVKELHHYSE